MSGWFIMLSNVITGGLRVLVCLFLICRLLSTGKPNRKSILAGLAGAVFLSVFLYVVGFPDFYQIALEAVWIAVCASVFQGADSRMSLYVGIFYEIALSFWLFLAEAGMGILFRSQDFLDCTTGSGQAAVWLFHGILLVLAGYLYMRQDMTGRNAFRVASGVAIAGFLAAIALSEQTILELPSDTLSMWTILAVVLMVSVLVFNMNRQYEMEKELAKLKSEQAKLLERDYTALNNAYAVNAKLFHDFHNHIGVLRQFLSGGKYKEAVQYLEELQEPVREMADTRWTGDETADYLINSKAASAVANGIQFQAQAEFPRHTNIRSADLCAVLGNLLDNALDAAKQVPLPEPRFIRLTIRRINQMLVIKVENSFSAMPVQEDGRLKSIKTENGLHGWGLKSAQAAVEKYDGLIQTVYTENTFRAVATLSYHEVPIIHIDEQ